MMYPLNLLVVAGFVLLVNLPQTLAFSPIIHSVTTKNSFGTTILDAQPRKIKDNDVPIRKMTDARRRKLGIADDEDEYDLEFALENNTDPFITKVISGSLIVAILGLLIAGVVIPATTDYGEGVCNTILTGGRC
jgi:hypothetical protein